MWPRTSGGGELGFVFCHGGSLILYPCLSTYHLFPHTSSAFLLSFSSLTALFSPHLASLTFLRLSVYQWGISVFHLLSGSHVIGVNGLGRMKHCVLLSEIAICFVWDQWGDPELVPAGDDGLMCNYKTIRNCQWENASQHSIESALILHFPGQRIYIF